MKYELAIFALHSSTESGLPIAPGDISLLYIAYLGDIIRKARTLVDRPVIYAADIDTLKPGVEALIGHNIDVDWRTPAGGHLGLQLAAVPAPCLIVCANAPTVPIDYLAQAADRLPSDDIVLGPSIDGGVYLLGLRKPTPSMFDDATWSASQDQSTAETSQVFNIMRTRAAQLDLTTRLLPPWYRVSSVDDLRRLALDLETLPSNSADDCPFTRAALDALDF